MTGGPGSGPRVVALVVLVVLVGAVVGADDAPTTTASAPTVFQLGDEGTPDPAVVREASVLLSNTEYAGATIHFMPQKVDDPDCHVVTFEEKRHGGRCSRMAGGFPYCAVKNYVFPNHPDCRDMPPDGHHDQQGQPWAAQWFARLVTPDMTSSTGETPPEEPTTTADSTPAPPQRQAGVPGTTDDVTARPARPAPDDRAPTPPPLRPTEAARAAWRRRGRAQPAAADDTGSNDDQR